MKFSNKISQKCKGPCTNDVSTQGGGGLANF